MRDEEAPIHGTTVELTEWFFEWLLSNVQRASQLVRLDEIASDMGSRVPEGNDADRYAFVLTQLNDALRVWMSGQPFTEMEVALGTAPNRVRQCENARKFALRWVVDVSYALGALTLVYKALAENERGATNLPAAIGTLAACSRGGFDRPEKLAISVISEETRSRRECHALLEAIAASLADPAGEERFETTILRVREGARAANVPLN